MWKIWWLSQFLLLYSYVSCLTLFNKAFLLLVGIAGWYQLTYFITHQLFFFKHSLVKIFEAFCIFIHKNTFILHFVKCVVFYASIKSTWLSRIKKIYLGQLNIGGYSRPIETRDTIQNGVVTLSKPSKLGISSRHIAMHITWNAQREEQSSIIYVQRNYKW